MYFRNVLGSLLHLFAVFSFLAAGSLVFSLYISDEARWVVIEWLFAQPEILFSLGATLLSAGAFLLLGVFALHRGKYLRLRLERHKADIDISLIQVAVERCLQQNFSQKIALIGVAAAKRRLEIEVETKQSHLLPILESKLIPLLRSQFGITHPVYLTVRSTGAVKE